MVVGLEAGCWPGGGGGLLDLSWLLARGRSGGWA